LLDSAYADLPCLERQLRGRQKKHPGRASPEITAFIAYFNQTMAKPFRWTDKGELLAS
jgi:hypothetical protein